MHAKMISKNNDNINRHFLMMLIQIKKDEFDHNKL